ncbi:MAG TPA: DUF433 domain-containing protein [Candidatus Angelobacter sp.]|nr:DUF433 domain-containing protein [Candidatus Angelobacter sp.]
MAKPVIHVSDTEAARDFTGLLAHVRAGSEVIIEHDEKPVAVLRPAVQRIDWSDCAQVETDPQRVSGRPTIRNTRMPVDDIVANYEYGVSVEEIAEQFGIAAETIRHVLSYAERHSLLARPLR